MMHLKRWITGLIALPFIVLLLSKGGLNWFTGVISIISVLGLWEYFRLVFDARPNGQTAFDGSHPGENQKPATHRLRYLSYIIGPGFVWATSISNPTLIICFIALVLILFVAVTLGAFKRDAAVLDSLFKYFIGFIYIPFLLSYLVLIRNGPDGIAWTYFLLCIVFAGDTGAYYAGSYWGAHKLCPAVSPGKTIEGSIGGLIANVGVGLLFRWLFLPALSLQILIWFCLLVGIAGQMGDLFESMIKRESRVKDSGTLVPGHGGVLDRIDALLFAAPMAYLFKIYAF
jgi:phosphatidate cytidylyltransferase